jgi:hypothetical protein
MITWKRGLDDRGRLWTFAIDDVGNTMTAYWPDESAQEFEYGPGNSAIHDGVPVNEWRETYGPAVPKYAAFKTDYRIVADADTTATPGVYHPRMWRGTEGPPRLDEARTATKRVARNLFSRLRDVFQVIEPDRAHDAAFGHELRQLLILACTEVEAGWRAILVANNARPTGRYFTTVDYVKLLGPMKLDSYALRLAAHPQYGEIEPFQNWNPANATGSLFWYDAYNATKHDREGELPRATVKAVIYALAAVHVMTVAQFGFDDITRTLFHADEFDFVRSWRWLGDAYIRPLLLPDQPLHAMAGGIGAVRVRWPTTWTPQDCQL